MAKTFVSKERLGYFLEKVKELIPKSTSQLENDSNFLTKETDPVYSESPAAGITAQNITDWNGKTSNTGTITEVKTTEGTHTAIDVKSGVASFNVPTATSHLTNDSNYITKADVPVASSEEPVMDNDAASAGESEEYARADHVHPTDTSRAAADHNHDNTYAKKTDLPTTGTAETEGLTRLYSETGQNDNGAMTQKAVTDAVDGKVSKAGDTMTGDLTFSGEERAIKYNSGTHAGSPIKFYPGGTSGSGIVIGDGGRIIIGGGESGESLRTEIGATPKDDEREEMHIANDNQVMIHTNCQNINSRQTFTFGTDGTLDSPAGYKISGSPLFPGGTNILRGTGHLIIGANNWTSGTWGHGGSGTYEVIDITDAPNPDITKGVKLAYSSGDIDYNLISQSPTIHALTGCTYTFSCYAKQAAGSGSTLRLQATMTKADETQLSPYPYINAFVTGEWGKFSLTFTIPADIKNINITCGLVHMQDGQEIEVCGMKLELGNVATDWSPSPRDGDAYYPGDTIEIKKFADFGFSAAFGYITGGGKDLYLTFPVGKPVRASKITVTQLKGGIESPPVVTSPLPITLIP